MSNDTYGYEEDFQKNIVSCALQDPSMMLQYKDILLPSYFDYDYLSSIVRTSRELTERCGEVPTKMTLVEEMKEFCVRFNLSGTDREFILGKLEDLYDTEISNIEYVRSKVVDFGQRQALRGAVLKIVTLFNQPSKGDDVYVRYLCIVQIFQFT